MTGISIAQALKKAQTLGLDRLDAQWLLLHILGKTDANRAWLLAHDADPLADDLAMAFKALSLRRANGEPLAYIVGYKEFFGLRLTVDARVLIPRPDTETLVQWALDVCQSMPKPEILDLGTGSGAVAIALARSLKTRVTATDFSQDALVVASQNAEQLGADVTFIHSNWLNNIGGQFHVIASNPPYVEVGDPHLAALVHEPLSALTAGGDGLDDIRQIIEQASKHLHAGGWLMLEHGYNQAAAVCDLLGKHGFKQAQSRTDLAGIARCSGGRWSGPASRNEFAG